MTSFACWTLAQGRGHETGQSLALFLPQEFSLTFCLLLDLYSSQSKYISSHKPNSTPKANIVGQGTRLSGEAVRTPTADATHFVGTPRGDSWHSLFSLLRCCNTVAAHALQMSQSPLCLHQICLLVVAFLSLLNNDNVDSDIAWEKLVTDDVWHMCPWDAVFRRRWAFARWATTVTHFCFDSERCYKIRLMQIPQTIRSGRNGVWGAPFTHRLTQNTWALFDFGSWTSDSLSRRHGFRNQSANGEQNFF